MKLSPLRFLLLLAATLALSDAIEHLRATAREHSTPQVAGHTIADWLPTADAARVDGGNYFLAYDGRTRSARYVVELLTPDDGSGADRSPGFRIDAAAPPEARAAAADYAGSGYDIGHLAPSANHVATAAANRSTFTYANAAPQNPQLNRGLWRTLETRLRTIAHARPVLIITAPLYLPDNQSNVCLATLGANRVWIPTHYGKAALTVTNAGPQVAAWIVPNRTPPAAATPDDFRVSVDEFESALGVDVFAALPDPLERQLERSPAAAIAAHD